jgi:hypothetical protein
VVKIYRLRTQVEEAFRDSKSHRYGLSLNDSATRDLERMQILLLVGSLAILVAWLVGKATELTEQHRRFQPNSMKDRVVLSTVFIGFEVIQDRVVRLTLAHFVAAAQVLQETINQPLEI